MAEKKVSNYVSRMMKSLEVTNEIIITFSLNTLMRFNLEMIKEIKMRFEMFKMFGMLDPLAQILLSRILDVFEDAQKAQLKADDSIQSVSELVNFDLVLLSVIDNHKHPLVRVVVVGYKGGQAKHVVPRKIKTTYTLPKQKMAHRLLEKATDALKKMVREIPNLEEWCNREIVWFKDQKDLDQNVTRRLGILECVVGAFVAIVEPNIGLKMIDDGVKMVGASKVEDRELALTVEQIKYSLEDAKEKLKIMTNKCENDVESINGGLEHLNRILDGMMGSHDFASELNNIRYGFLQQFVEEINGGLQNVATSCKDYFERPNLKVE